MMGDIIEWLGAPMGVLDPRRSDFVGPPTDTFQKVYLETHGEFQEDFHTLDGWIDQCWNCLVLEL